MRWSLEMLSTATSDDLRRGTQCAMYLCRIIGAARDRHINPTTA
jgi:hypothetical protein